MDRLGRVSFGVYQTPPGGLEDILHKTAALLRYGSPSSREESKISILRQEFSKCTKSLAKDVYIEEALNVLHDLKMTYAIKNKVAEVKN